MYPSAELDGLSRRKALLRQRIAVTRLRCAAYAGEAMRPLDWIDRFLTQWRKISPLAKLALLPLGLLFRRRVLHRKTRLFSRVLGWMPVVLRGIRLFRAQRSSAFAG